MLFIMDLKENKNLYYCESGRCAHMGASAGKCFGGINKAMQTAAVRDPFDATRLQCFPPAVLSNTGIFL